MAENTKNTKEKQRRSATMEELQKTYLPGMGHDWLLPLYDPLQKVMASSRSIDSWSIKRIFTRIIV